MKNYFSTLWISSVVIFVSIFNAEAASKIDPIKFTVTTSSTHLKLNEEFEITILAEYLNISPSTAYVLKDANYFKLKLTFPEGFIRTGGDYYDFVGTELSPSRPKVTYTLKGKFVSSGSGVFELLRSHRNADTQSTFVAVGKISFTPLSNLTDGKAEENLRIGASGFVPYMTITELRNGVAGSAEAVVITDPLRMGVFIYDPNDVSSNDDGAITLKVTATNKRYKREPGRVTPEMFGAIPNDGIDDYAAIQAAMDYPGRVIEFTPNGTYITSQELKPQSNQIITGNNATITTTANNFIRLIHIAGKDNVIVKSLILDGGATQDAGEQGIRIVDSRGVTISDCIIKNIGRENVSEFGFGIFVGVAGPVAPPTSTTGCKNIKIQRVVIDNIKGWGQLTGDGIYVKCSDNVQISECNINLVRRQGISITDYATNIDIIGTRISNTYLAGIDIEPNTAAAGQGTGFINITNCYITSFAIKPGASIGNQYFGIDVHSNFSHDITISGGSIIATHAQAISCINMMNGVTQIRVDNVNLDCGGLADNGISLAAGGGASRVSISNCMIRNFDSKGIVSFANADLSIKNNYFYSTTAIYGIYSNESDRYIAGNVLNLSGAGLVEGISVAHNGITNIQDNIVTVSQGTAYYVKSPSPSVLSGMNFSGNKAYNSGSAVNAFYLDPSTGTMLAPQVYGNFSDGTFTNHYNGRDFSDLVGSPTSAPTKSVLNASLGLYPSKTKVRYPNITGGARDYEKISDKPNSDWIETIWSTGAKSIVP
jgi:hypothetical protein